MKFNALHDQRYKGLQTEFEIVKEGKFLKQKISRKVVLSREPSILFKPLDGDRK